MLCCECDTTFHRACLNPAPANVPDTCTWVCDGCQANDSAEKTPVKEVAEEPKSVDKASPFFSPASLGPWVMGTRQLELKGPPFEWDCNGTPDPKIPDASAWSHDDVFKYFAQLGFEEQASILRQNVSFTLYRFAWTTLDKFIDCWQEIDGASLLLMKRNDLVGNARIGLKLGPAVKIYNHIRRLQTRRADLIFA